MQILNYSYLIPVVLSLLYIRKVNHKNILLIVITYGILFSLLNIYFYELLAFFKGGVYYFSYTLLEYGTFASLIFINVKSKKARLVIVATSVLFTIFLFMFNFAIKVRTLDSIPVGAETLILILFSFYFFYEQFKNVSSLYIYNHYCFWFTIGILIYLCGSLFIYVLSDQMTSAEHARFWFFSYIMEIIKNILFGVAVIVYSRTSTHESKKLNIPYLDITEL